MISVASRHAASRNASVQIHVTTLGASACVTTTSAPQQATCPFSVTHHLQEILQSHTTHLPSGSLVTFSFFLEAPRSHRWRLPSWHSGQLQDAPDNRTHSHAHTLRTTGHSWVLLEISSTADNLSHSSYARCAQAQQGYIALVTAHRWLCLSLRHHFLSSCYDSPIHAHLLTAHSYN